jgi:hypothetical protein
MTPSKRMSWICRTTPTLKSLDGVGRRDHQRGFRPRADLSPSALRNVRFGAAHPTHRSGKSARSLAALGANESLGTILQPRNDWEGSIQRHRHEAPKRQLARSMEGLAAWVLTAALDVFGKADPRVLALLKHRDRGRWELRIGKGAHRNANEIVVPFFRVVHRRTAVGTR